MGSLSGGLFGNKPAATTSSPTLSEDSLLNAAKSDVDATAQDLTAAAQACPQFIVWPSSQQATVYEAGREGDGLAIVHRGEITQTARECYTQPGQVTVKYGFSGRVLLGPKGQSGTVSLPVNVFATDHSKQRVAGEALSVSVDISAEKPIGYFSAVKTLTIPVPEGSRAADLKIYVAFDKVSPAG